MGKKPYKLVSREHKREDSIIKINNTKIGDKEITIIAGPCSVENEEQLTKIADFLEKNNIPILRASLYKPRTSPYDFQGLGESGLDLLKKIKEKNNLLIETEVMDPRELKKVLEVADIIRVGSRNMQNFPLLKELGKIDKPIILKRGMNATVEEFLGAAEYIAKEGNHNIILCERGIRTFEQGTRNSLDLNAIPLLKELSHLPVIVDPSHGTGKKSLVIPMSKAAIAAGADGLMIEVHPEPEKSISDSDQTLSFEMFEKLISELKPLANAIKRIL